MNDQVDALQSRARERIGQVLREKWRLDSLLGVGGMAAVYAATHVNNGRRAAIKLLHTELSVNLEVRTRFLREGYVANKVEHPGTVSVLDDQVNDDGTVFLVMELLEGETLEDRRERSGSLPAHEVLSLTDRLLDVLAAAHEKGIVHRDIKPENIFLTREGAVKVLDFGIARMRELQAARLTLTTAGAIGTPAFMPPEQARGRWDDVGPRSDIWALGATMFTLVSGRLVHQAETVNELMLAAMTQQAPPVASIVPNLPPQVAAVIDRALAYDSNARWPDARTMQAALRAAYQSLDRASIVSGPSGAFQAYRAPVAAVPAAAHGFTGHPVTLAGGPGGAGGMGAAPLAPAQRAFPVLAVVGGLVGALATGAVVLFAATRHPSTGTQPSAASASTSAQAAPTPDRAGDGPAATAATAAGTSTATAGATAAATADPTPTAPSTATAGASAEPATAASGSASPAAEPASSARPRVTVPIRPRPGSAWHIKH